MLPLHGRPLLLSSNDAEFNICNEYPCTVVALANLLGTDGLRGFFFRPL